MRPVRPLINAATVLLAGAMGCGSADDPVVAGLRAGLLMAQEPPGAVTIAEARQQLEEHPDVVLVGRIGHQDHEGYERGVASLLLSEAPEGGHGDDLGHDADNCPFCRRKALASPLAVVEFVDPSGNLLPYGADALLGVQKGDVVVVRGRGELDPRLDLLKITADGIFVRR